MKKRPTKPLAPEPEPTFYQQVSSRGKALINLGVAMQNPDIGIRDLASLAYEAGLRLIIKIDE